MEFVVYICVERKEIDTRNLRDLRMCLCSQAATKTKFHYKLERLQQCCSAHKYNKGVAIG